MKKTLLLLLVFTTSIFFAQETIYDTTHASANGVEIAAAANGLNTKMGDAIVIAGTARYLTSVTVDMFNLNDASAFSVTMSLYSDCPSTTGAGVCGSGPGTLIPNSTVTVSVASPPATLGTIFEVVFPYNNLNLAGETDNGITVMMSSSRSNVFWRLGETPTIGAMPSGETGFGFATRCGSTQANNGCARNFGIANNFAMKLVAIATLNNENFINSRFNIYPNPAKNSLNINSSSNEVINSVKIIDINGRIIKNLKVNATSNVIDVNDLANGVYLVEITSETGTITKKFIKE